VDKGAAAVTRVVKGEDLSEEQRGGIRKALQESCGRARGGPQVGNIIALKLSGAVDETRSPVTRAATRVLKVGETLSEQHRAEIGQALKRAVEATEKAPKGLPEALLQRHLQGQGSLIRGAPPLG